MLKLVGMLVLGGASTACAFAAVGATLYAHSPAVAWVAQCFAAFGFAAGLACGGLQLHFHGRPAHAPAALAPDELAGLVRAAVASAAAMRAARPGSAADRHPAGDIPTATPTATPAATSAIATTAQPAPQAAVKADADEVTTA